MAARNRQRRPGHLQPRQAAKHLRARILQVQKRPVASGVAQRGDAALQRLARSLSRAEHAQFGRIRQIIQPRPRRGVKLQMDMGVDQRRQHIAVFPRRQIRIRLLQRRVVADARNFAFPNEQSGRAAVSVRLVNGSSFYEIRFHHKPSGKKELPPVLCAKTGSNPGIIESAPAGTCRSAGTS